MSKKMIIGLLALAFICWSLLLMGACATKQAQVSEAGQPTTEEMKAPGAEEAGMVGTEAEGTEESERLARLRKLQDAQRFADEARMFESEDIYFDFDKSNLKPESKAILRKRASWLRNNMSSSIRIEGHCDERGSNEYNLALGERRAHAAKQFLMALGISGDRILTISYGEERPAAPGHDEGAWEKNRRDELKLIK
jgi:peptidoglycan-associated lipoprotein